MTTMWKNKADEITKFEGVCVSGTGDRGAFENRAKRSRNMKRFLLLLLAPFIVSPAFAVIDTTDAVAAITDGQTAVVAVLVALIVAYGAFLGYRMVKAVVKRGG
jgi:hypothetical protein